MPFYEYVCESCGKDFVLLQSMTAKAEDTACPYCDQKKARSRFPSSRRTVRERSAAPASPGARTEGHSPIRGPRMQINLKKPESRKILRLFVFYPAMNTLGHPARLPSTPRDMCR